MARRAYTQDLYDRLVKAFREKPGNASNAARWAGCERRCAARAWANGWPNRPWAIPIQRYLIEEKEAIRVERQRAMEESARIDEEARAQLRKDAIDAQKHEALAVRGARINAIALSNMISKLLPSLINLSESTATQIKSGSSAYTPHQVLHLMRSASYVVRQSNEAARLALELERIRVGDPNDIFKSKDEDEQDDDEVVTALMGLNRTLRRARKDPMSMPSEVLIAGSNGSFPDEEIEIDLDTGRVRQVH